MPLCIGCVCIEILTQRWRLWVNATMHWMCMYREIHRDGGCGLMPLCIGCVCIERYTEMEAVG